MLLDINGRYVDGLSASEVDGHLGHLSDPAFITVLVAETLKNPFRSVALLRSCGLVGFEDHLDHSEKQPELRLRPPDRPVLVSPTTR